MRARQLVGPDPEELIALWGFQIGDRVREAIGAHQERFNIPTVVSERKGRHVRTQTGRWYDAITGAIDRRFGEVGYHGLHSADVVVPLVGTGAHA